MKMSSSLRGAELCEHFFEQFQWQPDHIRPAALCDMEPIGPVLVTEGASLASPEIGFQVVLQGIFAKRIHLQVGDCDLGLGNSGGQRPDAESAVDPVRLPAESGEHAGRVVSILWFAENLATAFGNRVAADDYRQHFILGRVHSSRDIDRLAKCETGDQFRRSTPAANSLVFIDLRIDPLKIVAGFGQQRSPLGRATGENQLQRFFF